MKAIFLGIALLAIGGCASKTPPEAARVHGIAATDAPAIDACWRKVLTSPQHQALKARTGDHADSPTAAMKSNPQKATPQEAAQLLSLQQDYLAPCRKMALQSAAKVHPDHRGDPDRQLRPGRRQHSTTDRTRDHLGRVRVGEPGDRHSPARRTSGGR